ncbi:MAG: permease-like cell division protein FtsX [Candidatus Margulisiibacteriota bacterium]
MSIYTDVEFYVVEGFRGVKRSGIMSLVAIGIVTVSLIVFGFFLLSIVNLGNIVSNMGARLDIVAYVDENLTEADAEALQQRIGQIEGVERTDFISREQAWKTFKDDFGHKLDLKEVVSDNPLPNTFAVKVRTPELIPNVARDISRISVVNEIRYSGKLIKQVQTLVDAVRLGGFIIVLLLFFATLLIVVNTIRLTVLARTTDIEIMRLVGATNSFIRWPFVIEGVLIGIIGGVIGTMILKSSYDTMSAQLIKALPFLPVVISPGILKTIYISVGSTGALLGMIGGYISVSGILKRRVK